MALLVTRNMRWSNFFRSGFFVPNLIKGLILGYLWRYIFLYLFPLVGIRNLLVDAAGGLLALVILTVWQMAGVHHARLHRCDSEHTGESD